MGFRVLSIVFAVVAVILGLTLLIDLEAISSLLGIQQFTVIVGLGTIDSAITAILMGRSAVKTSQFEAIKEYFLNGDTLEMREARSKKESIWI